MGRGGRGRVFLFANLAGSGELCGGNAQHIRRLVLVRVDLALTQGSEKSHPEKGGI
jgi:hypothetical protein